ncbi:MAG: VOC family protein [Pyrinomonadaceae bacterium]|nr:VOC family protein [Pyrinomonadaceae bacterium]
MRFNELRPMIWTEDLEGSVAFYTGVLGFECDALDQDQGWASVSRDGVGVMFCRPNQHMPHDGLGFTGSFYFTTDDVDGIWDQVADRTRVVYGIEDFPYGMREFAVYDNNGYMLQFGQEIDS